MTYRTNMSYRGSNNLARLLYDTNCQMFEVTPLTIRANSDAVVECLPEAMERVITELKQEYLLDESMKLFHRVVQLASTKLSIEFTEEQIACHKETMGELIRLGYSNPVWRAAGHHEREGIHRSPITNSTHWYYFSDLIEKTAATYLFFESSEQVLEKVGLEWVTKEGRFPKRVSSYFWKNYGIRLSKEQLTKLGNDFDKCRIPKETFYMRITNNFNWQDGQYGKEGSCWWASYGHSRDTLHHHGGYGVLFYKDADGLHDDDGIGRMWLSALDDNMAVGFNYYGPSQDRYIASAVARMLEILTNESWVYGKRDLAHCGGMYVNDGVGFLFYKKGTEVPKDTVYLDYDKINSGEYFVCGCGCEHCGEWIDDLDDTTYIDGVGRVCEYCINNHYFWCDGCSEYYRTNDECYFEDSGNSYCESCFERRINFTCDNCGQSFEEEYGSLMKDTERTYCDDCLSDLNYVECEHGYFENGCDDCAEESEEEPNE